MNSPFQVFFDITLPNASTWFYFSLILSCAFFLKFNRLISFRSLDVFAIYLFMPGLLLLLEGSTDPRVCYSWLMIASLYWLIRCLLDLILERRPAFKPNLNVPGMLWMAMALYVSLVAVAIREPQVSDQKQLRSQTPIDKVREHGEKMIEVRSGANLDVSVLRLWMERGLFLFCHLVISVALVLICWKHYGDYHLGFAAVTLFFLLPYSYLLMPYAGLKFGRWDHSWLMTLLLWALVFYQKPKVSGGLMGILFGSLVFPIVLLPLWISFYRGRGMIAFVASALVGFVTSLAIVFLAYEGNANALISTWIVSDWLPWREPMADTQSFWHGIHWAYRLPVSLVFLVFSVSVFFWPFPKLFSHLVALSAALLIGIQFWYANHGGMYILWYLPLLMIVIFRPSFVVPEKNIVQG